METTTWYIILVSAYRPVKQIYVHAFIYSCMSMYLYIFIYCKYMYEDMHACMYVIIYVYMY